MESIEIFFLPVKVCAYNSTSLMNFLVSFLARCSLGPMRLLSQLPLLAKQRVCQFADCEYLLMHSRYCQVAFGVINIFIEVVRMC